MYEAIAGALVHMCKKETRQLEMVFGLCDRYYLTILGQVTGGVQLL